MLGEKEGAVVPELIAPEWWDVQVFDGLEWQTVAPDFMSRADAFEWAAQNNDRTRVVHVRVEEE